MLHRRPRRRTHVDHAAIEQAKLSAGRQLQVNAKFAEHSSELSCRAGLEILFGVHAWLNIPGDSTPARKNDLMGRRVPGSGGTVTRRDLVEDFAGAGLTGHAHAHR
ncbi:MAG: hypothetical protein WD010_07575 [Nitriliruptor sp.]